MNYSSFIKEITQRVQERIKEGYKVEVTKVRKNNGVMLDSLVIWEPGGLVCPNIYLNQVYDDYLKGGTIEQEAENILSWYYNTVPALRINADLLVTPEIIRQQVVYRLINYSRNESLLEDVPHKRFLDLALIYYIMVYNEEMGDGAIMVRNDLLDHYEVTQEELDEAARQNTVKLLPADFLKISDLLQEFGEKSGAHSYTDISLEEESAASPLYVLTNKMRQFGAYYMTDMDVLSEISKELNSDLYILPSSVHECMVVSAEIWDDTDDLAAIVREINRLQVPEDEYLADTVYRFCLREKKMEIAA